MAIPGTTPVAAPIAPTSEIDVFATHQDWRGAGGLRSVETAIELEAIFVPQLVVGMEVYVADEKKFYRLDLITINGTQYNRVPDELAYESATRTWIESPRGGFTHIVKAFYVSDWIHSGDYYYIDIQHNFDTNYVMVNVYPNEIDHYEILNTNTVRIKIIDFHGDTRFNGRVNVFKLDDPTP